MTWSYSIQSTSRHSLCVCCLSSHSLGAISVQSLARMPTFAKTVTLTLLSFILNFIQNTKLSNLNRKPELIDWQYLLCLHRVATPWRLPTSQVVFSAKKILLFIIISISHRHVDDKLIFSRSSTDPLQLVYINCYKHRTFILSSYLIKLFYTTNLSICKTSKNLVPNSFPQELLIVQSIMIKEYRIFMSSGRPS